ncbi:MAG: PDZ domain-containing protein, partial [Clostridia bacterium]|nr:PDZ domain-containing protein [Clostridia bacterium]
MKKQLRRLAALTLLLVSVLLLASCRQEKPDDLGELASSALGTYTTAAVTSSPDGPPLTVEELAAFLTLVDFAKVESAEDCYEAYYIGDYRPVSACFGDLFDALSALPAIRTVTDPERATGAFIEIYARLLGDYYGYYYPPTDYSDYTDDIAGKYTGIGVSVLLDAEGYAEIINVFPGSPAEEVGLLPGDVLVAVGGEDFAAIGYQNAIDRIRGETGTSVSLTVRRDGVRRDFTVPRREVTEVTVESRMMDGNLGYIRLISFNERTYQQFVAAHRALEAAGAVSYVFDLRNNPGGTLNAVVAIAEYILPDGPIVHLNYKDDRDDFT